MTHRPWPIVVIALFHIIAPAINFIMSARLLGMTLGAYFDHQSHYGPMTLFIWAIPFFAGISLLTFRMWSYYLFLGFMVLATVFTFYQRILYPHRIDIFLFLFMELVNFVVILYFLSPAVKRIYINKRIRWWQHSPRFLIEYPADVHIKFAQENLPPLMIKSKILNISSTGAYIESTEKLDSNDNVTLRFQAYGKQYEIKSQIVHAQKNGYGLLFSNSVTTQFEMKKLIKELKKNKIPLRGSEMTTLESFRFWFHDLLRTGQGIFPK